MPHARLGLILEWLTSRHDWKS